MGEDRCPFCGMYSKKEQSPAQIEFQCDTIITDSFPELPLLGKDCLMGQVSRLSGELQSLKILLKEAVGHIKELTDKPFYKQGWAERVLKAGKFIISPDLLVAIKEEDE